MFKREDNTKKKLRNRTDQGAVTTGTEVHRIDNVQNPNEAETVTPTADQRIGKAHPVEIDQVFDILRNYRRRSVLRYMQTVEDEVTLGTLAEQVAAWECGKDLSQITSSERKCVYVGLYQSHLTKMDDVGAIKYNKARGKIQPGENRELFEQYLPVTTDDTNRTWTNYQWVLPLVIGLLTLVLGLVWLIM